MDKKIIETEVVFGKKEAMIPRVKSATVKGLVVWTSMVCQQYNEIEYDLIIVFVFVTFTTLGVRGVQIIIASIYCYSISMASIPIL